MNALSLHLLTKTRISKSKQFRFELQTTPKSGCVVKDETFFKVVGIKYENHLPWPLIRRHLRLMMLYLKKKDNPDTLLLFFLFFFLLFIFFVANGRL